MTALVTVAQDGRQAADVCPILALQCDGMPLGAQIVFRLPADLDQAVRALAELNGRTLAEELRAATSTHVVDAAASLNVARPGSARGDARPTPTSPAEAHAAGR